MGNEDGQHRQRGGGGQDDGQKHRRERGTEVGQERGHDTTTRTLPPNADISTEVMVGGLSEEAGEPQE